VDPLVELQKLRKPTSTEQLDRLIVRLRTHLDVIEETSFEVGHVELDLARSIAASLTRAVHDATKLDADNRATLGAAIEYFILSADADHDLTSAQGLHDDASVANAALGLIGRSDLAIDLPGNDS